MLNDCSHRNHPIASGEPRRPCRRDGQPRSDDHQQRHVESRPHGSSLPMTASARKPGCPPDDSRPAAAPLPLAKCGAFSSEKVASSSTYTARQSMSRADHGELSVVVAGATIQTST